MRPSLLLLCLSLLASGTAGQLAFAQDEPSDEKESREQEARQRAANLLRVVSLLLKDGHHERAAATLATVAPTTPGLDRARYHTLDGLLALRRGHHLQASRALEAALAAGQKEQSAFLLLAQARFGLGRYRDALAAIDRAGALASQHAGAHVLRAQCHWRLGDRGAAWRALQAGLRLFPRDRELQRQHLLLLVDLGLYQQATSAGLAWLGRAAAGAGDYLAIAEALSRSKQPARAILILEQARLCFPENELVLKQLARSYLGDRKPLAAAELLARAAHRVPEYRLEAAELYRRAGQLYTALHHNEQASDQKGKVRQRLGILIDLQRFEEAAAMGPRLSRLGLLTDENIVYALAYALFQTRRFDEAEHHLRRLTRSELFARGVQLRRAMEVCRRKPQECS